MNDDTLKTIELAWGLIANAYGGDWDTAPADWKKAAIKWRDERWHPLVNQVAEKKENQEVDEPTDLGASAQGLTPDEVM